MYVALPVGTAADKWGEGEKKTQPGKARSVAQLGLAHTHTHTHALFAWRSKCIHFWKWIHLKIAFFIFLLGPVSSIIDSRYTDIYTHRHRHRHAHTPLQYFCLFILCRLIPKWPFFWSPVYVSSQTGLSSLLLLSRLLCVSVVPYMRSQWNNGLFPVKKNWVCQVSKKEEGLEDKWREGMRGCKDNSLLWWVTFQCGVSNESMAVLLCVRWQRNDWRSQDQFHPGGWEVHYLQCLPGSSDLFVLFSVWE